MSTANEETVEFWRGHVEGYAASGQTREGYCTTHGIKLYRLIYWRKKFNRPHIEKTAERSDWIPIKISEEEPCGIELKVGKIQIAVNVGFNPTLLREVLRVLTA